ncbi:hypothetical protein ABFX02_05G053200 [Erythranthe guttata]
MSGLGQKDQAELSSERTYNDRIPHFCNMLRFAVLRKNNSLMAIGGPWDTVDGGDPSVDDSSLIRTALRHAKDVTDLDLTNCRHWNRFLEIHYERVGKDGLFSHKEVTVLYVPDLADCLPSLDSWRDQWLNHKKAVSERERLQSLKKEITGGKKESPKDKKKPEHLKDSMTKKDLEKKRDPLSSGQPEDDSKKEKDTNKIEGNIVSEEGNKKDKAVEIKKVADDKNVVKKVQEGDPNSQIAVGAKTVKKKIVKRIVKKKVVKKSDNTEIATGPSDEVVKDGAGGNNVSSEVDGQQEGLSVTTPAIKTFVRKRIVKKPVGPAVEKDESSSLEPEMAVDNAKAKSEDSNVVAQDGITKTTVKKKIIKRVPKRKAISTEKVAEDALEGGEDNKGKQKEAVVEKQMNEVISKSTSSPEKKPDKKEEKKTERKDLSGSAMETDNVNQKVPQNDNRAKSNEKAELKGEKEKKVVEKKRSDEPPQHPGLILRTKETKVSKMKSLSHSLDSLLDYSGNDIEESNFELSLFAESFYEMLQYEMGCRLLAFLQKLRIKFVAKRNKGKRQREETLQKENEESSSIKRVKTDTDTSPKDIKSTKTEDTGVANGDDIKIETKEPNAVDAVGDDSIIMKKEPNTGDADGDDSKINKEPNATEHVETTKIENDVDEEDPEEEPEEDEEMPQATSPHHNPTKEECVDAEKKAGDAVCVDIAKTEPKEEQETVKQTPETVSSPEPSNKEKLPKAEPKKKGTQTGVDKELLQAFRFFDRNRVGHIRVEDLRLIIHNLGKFLTHRDVKELVQSALLESNTGRDDRVLYDKLVKMSDI